MVEHIQNYDVLEKCTKDILSIIKPTEDDQNKRLNAIQEIVDSIYLVGRLGDAAVKPFGSFLSKLYAKSGDLDVSVELPNVSGFPTSKEKKQSLLGELHTDVYRPVLECQFILLRMYSILESLKGIIFRNRGSTM
ncbi:hypothetical protein VPH35_061559 [Triticum aestivum]